MRLFSIRDDDIDTMLTMSHLENITFLPSRCKIYYEAQILTMNLLESRMTPLNFSLEIKLMYQLKCGLLLLVFFMIHENVQRIIT